MRVNISDVRDAAQPARTSSAARTSSSTSPARRATSTRWTTRSPTSRSTAAPSSRSSRRAAHHNPELQIVFASTRQIYGRPQIPPGRREAPARPGRRQRHQQDGRRVVPPPLRATSTGCRVSVLRLTNTYGPRMRVKDARQTFLGIWIRLAARRARSSTSSATGRSGATSPTSTTPCARSCLAAASTRRVGRGLQPRRREVRQPARARRAASSAGRGAAAYRLVPFPRRPQGDRHRRLLRRLHASSARELGWRPVGRRSRTGSRATLDYYRAHGAEYWETA